MSLSFGKTTNSCPPNFEDIFDAFLTDRNLFNDSLDLQKISRYYETDTTAYLVYEVPRLKRDTIAVTIEPARITPKQYDIVVEAKQLTLNSYTPETDAATPYKKKFRLAPLQEYALDGSLTLAYSEGVLVVEIPLTKPVQVKKATLSARLADIES